MTLRRLLRGLARRRVPLGFASGASRCGSPADAAVAGDRRGVAIVGRSAAHLGGRASREGPRGDGIGAVRVHAASALLSGRRSWAIGLAVASRSAPVAVLVFAYLAVTMTAAIRTEEAHLTEKFGGDYPAYREGRARAGAPAVQPRARDAEPRVSRGARAAGGAVGARGEGADLTCAGLRICARSVFVTIIVFWRRLSVVPGGG